MLGPNWLLISILVVVLILLWCAAVLSKYVRLMLNIIREMPPPLLMGPFDFQKHEGLQVNFRSYDGTLLRGMFLGPADLQDGAERQNPSLDEYLNKNTRGIVVFCHEWGSDRYSSIRYCRGLIAAGYIVFSFDFRSHGLSENSPGYTARLWCTDKEVNDCLGAVCFLRQELDQRGLTPRLGLFGISRGASAAVLTAAHPHLPMSIRAVLADSIFSTDWTLEHHMKKWAHIFARVRIVYENHPPVFWRFLRWMLLQVARRRFGCSFPSTRKAVGQLKRTALFFIHGSRDSYIRPETAQRIYAVAQSPAYFWLVDAAKHNQAAVTDPDRYAARALAFFEYHMHRRDLQKLPLAEPWREDTLGFFGWPAGGHEARDNRDTAHHDQESDRAFGQSEGAAATETL